MPVMVGGPMPSFQIVISPLAELATATSPKLREPTITMIRVSAGGGVGVGDGCVELLDLPQAVVRAVKTTRHTKRRRISQILPGKRGSIRTNGAAKRVSR